MAARTSTPASHQQTQYEYGIPLKDISQDYFEPDQLNPFMVSELYLQPKHKHEIHKTVEKYHQRILKDTMKGDEQGLPVRRTQAISTLPQAQLRLSTTHQQDDLELDHLYIGPVIPPTAQREISHMDELIRITEEQNSQQQEPVPSILFRIRFLTDHRKNYIDKHKVTPIIPGPLQNLDHTKAKVVLTRSRKIISQLCNIHRRGRILNAKERTLLYDVIITTLSSVAIFAPNRELTAFWIMGNIQGLESADARLAEKTDIIKGFLPMFQGPEADKIFMDPNQSAGLARMALESLHRLTAKINFVLFKYLTSFSGKPGDLGSVEVIAADVKNIWENAETAYKACDQVISWFKTWDNNVAVKVTESIKARGGFDKLFGLNLDLTTCQRCGIPRSVGDRCYCHLK